VTRQACYNQPSYSLPRHYGEIHPFYRLTVQPCRLDADVLTQPYDKISPKCRRRYYALIRTTSCALNRKSRARDNDGNNVYTRAARFPQDWKKEGVLATDSEPSIYAYSQIFDVPDGRGGTPRRGWSVADSRPGKIAEYADKNSLQAEQTLAKPKADRLNLLRRHTRTFRPDIHVVFDPKREIEQSIWSQQKKLNLLPS